jgi:hypothetical protein
MIRRSWLAVLAIAALALVVVAPGPVRAAPSGQATYPPGAVIGLAGTPHLWVADDQGVLHWSGDTRALAGHAVSWGSRVDLSVDQLRAARRGDPWLSAGLLKMGEPIYLVKWETDQQAPTLLHIQSIADVELFGINGDNYGAFVLDQPQWEARFGMSAANLQRGELQPAVPSAATPTATTAPGAATPTPGGSAPNLRLNQTPALGANANVTFVPVTTSNTWTEGFSVDPQSVHLEGMYSENVIGKWTVTDGAYVQVSAISLDYNPDVKTVADLAKRKFAVFCRDTEFCSGTDAPVALTVGGASAQQYDTRSRVRHEVTTGSTTETVVNEWLTRHVFVIYGNWGYEFRFFTEDPGKFSDWVRDFDKLIGAVTFKY